MTIIGDATILNVTYDNAGGLIYDRNVFMIQEAIGNFPCQMTELKHKYYW
jgi:hypothetical protein